MKPNKFTHYLPRKVHDLIMEHNPTFIKHLFENSDKPVWTMAGVTVTMDESTRWGLHNNMCAVMHELARKTQ